MERVLNNGGPGADPSPPKKRQGGPHPGHVFATLSWDQFDTPVRHMQIRGKVKRLARGDSYATMLYLGDVQRGLQLSNQLVFELLSRIGLVPGNAYEDAMTKVSALEEVCGELRGALKDCLAVLGDSATGVSIDGTAFDAAVSRAKVILDAIGEAEQEIAAPPIAVLPDRQAAIPSGADASGEF